MPASLPPSPSLSHLSTGELYSQLAPITSLPGQAGSIFTNWASTFESQTASTFRPTTVEEVRLVVELARREGKELRPSGSGHSPSDLVCTDGFVINLDRIGRVLELDTTTCLAHFEGGIQLHAVNAALFEAGLALSSLGSISDQTFAGAISTATHGSGVTFGNLSSTVRFLDLVLPTEGVPVVRVSRDEDEELFLSALCGLGMVGVIVGVGVQAERIYKLEEECWSMKFEDYVERCDEIAESAEHVRCWWFPQVGEVKVSRLNRTSKALTPPPNAVKSYIIDTLIGTHFHAIILTLSRTFPNILPYHAQLMYALVHRPASIFSSSIFRPVYPLPKLSIERSNTSERTPLLPGEKVKVVELASTPKSERPFPMVTTPTLRVDWSFNIFNYDCGFPQYTYEAAVPYDRTAECLKDLEQWETKELNDPNGLRSHFPIEFRFTEKDDIWLSPTYGQRATYIGAIQYRPYNLPVPYRSLFAAFEAHLLAHGARPHWAKSHNCTPEKLRALYPKFNDFLRVRERVDPQGVLLNAYAMRHLVGGSPEKILSGRYRKSGRA
ncbi:L-gulonolactone oxidase, partial [Phenoliferia sp. Uapishka_3]